MQIIKLKVTDFDDMENVTSLAEFISSEKYFLNSVAYMDYMGKITTGYYKGWNGETYPKYETDLIEVHE